MDNLYNPIYYFTLAEISAKSVEIMRTGDWNHPQYGKFSITANDIDLFIKHFNERVRGVDLAIDLEHGATSHKGEAAGWIKSLQRVDNRLLAEIEWTELGKEKVSTQQFRYFSPEFTFSYKDAESGKEYQNVLMGGALTNKPFIKNMAPVLLSEAVYEEIQQGIGHVINTPNKEENKMKLSEIVRKNLNLSEDASEEVVYEAITKFVTEGVALSEKMEGLQNEVSTLKSSIATKEAEIVSLKEKENATNSTNVQLAERILAMETKWKESEWEQLSTKYLNEGKMTSAMLAVFKKNFLNDREGTIALMETLQPVVTLGERGSSQGESEVGSTNGAKKFSEKVNSIVTERKVSYLEALTLAETEYPELFVLYQNERRGL